MMQQSHLFTLNDEFANNGITQVIIDDIQQSLNPLNRGEKVDKLIIVDKLPYRSSGKIDINLALEKEAEVMKRRSMTHKTAFFKRVYQQKSII